MPGSHLSIGVAMLGGILTVLSPCVLPILPVLIGRSLHTHRFGPVVLVVGLVSGFAFTGSLLGITASWLTELTNAIRIIAIVLLFILGLLAIFPSWSYRLFSRFPVSNWVREPTRIGLAGEFWLGTQLGLLWTPCAGPVLASILVLAAVNHDIVGAFGLLSAYGIGAALPLLLIAYGGRKIGRRLLKLRSHSALLQQVGGVIIIATAIAILLGWDVQLQLWLAPFFPNLPL